ncbi:MAG TPA: glycosyltransferase [Nitrososphaeraceae archaeon]|nr:glycosyltransferase [Nitrososphaeraceae archaeon]
MEFVDAKLPNEQKTVSIGIPSFNEEANISRLLHSIVKLNNSSLQPGQPNSSKEDSGATNGNNIPLSTNFKITEVIISDDSSDNTSKIVKEIAAANPSLNIRLLHHETRRGVSAAWNEIFREASGEIIVLYDADIIIDADATAHLVESMKGHIGLCASNPMPLLLKTSIVARASRFVAHWLGSVRNERLSQYTVMGRALSISSKAAKRIVIPENVIALDLYLQCKVLEQGLGVLYKENAVVYFKPPDNMLDFSSQILRATNGHKQIKHLAMASRCNLDFETGAVTTLKSAIKDPEGAVCLILCYLSLPYYKTKLSDIDSVKWHIAKSTKRLLK